MIANLGNYCLFCSLFVGLAICIFSVQKDFAYKRYLNYLIIIFHLIIIFAFFIMLYLFITSDMRVVSVLLHSSSLLELKYKIAGTWGSHETSTLFWATINSVIYLIFDYQTKTEGKITKSILNMLQTFFVAYLCFFSNPFLQISSTPTEGLGMNPSLQDMGMMIHPPMLFISYSIYMLIYASTIAYLLQDQKICHPELDSGSTLSYKDSRLRGNDVRYIKSWSSYGFAFITAAVALGGWWAYRELGWGGYWFFDPVENISLLVWLFAISLHHTLLQKNMDLSKFLLGIAPFISAIFGTFLVRSGMLTSVHSFADSGGSKAILAFSIIILALPLVMFALKFNLIKKASEESRKYYFMQTGNFLWVASGFIIILSLIIPILSDQIIGDIIEIKPGFFIITLIPLTLIASMFAGLIYFNRDARKLIIAVLLNLPSIPLSIYYFKSSNLIAFSYFVALLVMTCSIYRSYERYTANSLNTKAVSMLLSHFAAGLFILACSINNNFTISKNIVFNLGEKAKLHDNISVNLSDIKYSEGKNYIRQIAYLQLIDDTHEIITLKPELRFYPIEKSLSSEVDIFSYVTADWYGVINNIDKERVSATIIYHPAISFMWFSAILCVFGILLPRIIKNN